MAYPLLSVLVPPAVAAPRGARGVALLADVGRRLSGWWQARRAARDDADLQAVAAQVERVMPNLAAELRSIAKRDAQPLR